VGTMWGRIGNKMKMENPYPRPQMPQKIGAPSMCVAPTHRLQQIWINVTNTKPP